MPWTLADLDKLKKAIATGAKVSEFRSGDTSRKVELRSLDEMLRLKGEIEAELAAAQAPAGPTSYLQHSRD